MSRESYTVQYQPGWDYYGPTTYTGISPSTFGTASVQPFISMFQFLQSELFLYENEIIVNCNLKYYKLDGHEVMFANSVELTRLDKTLYQFLQEINKGIVNGKNK